MSSSAGGGGVKRGSSVDEPPTSAPTADEVRLPDVKRVKLAPLRAVVEPILVRSDELETHRLYFTKIDGLPPRFNEFAYSLSELLAQIRPVSSIHFNFMVDTEWLISQYPEGRREWPITIVVGDKLGTSVEEIEREADAGGWTNITAVSAALPIPFGVHHSKLSLFEDEFGCVHVVVGTANLLQHDWEAKTQMFYYMCSTVARMHERTPRRIEKGIPIVTDLIDYMERYKMGALAKWQNLLRDRSFEFTVNRIVFSVPGYHQGEEMNSVGHRSVRQILREARCSDQCPRKTLICQSSSIGSLGPRPGAWLGGEFTLSMRAGRDPSGTQCWMVYPTKEDVEGSVGGKAAGGGSLPYSRATAEKQEWLQKNLCKWRSENWGRSRIMPHVKSYLQVDQNTRRFDWQIVTSANLSKAAWGQLQKNGIQLMIRSYEIGVLVMDPRGIRVPFDYPLCRYKEGDRPWYIEDMHSDE